MKYYSGIIDAIKSAVEKDTKITFIVSRESAYTVSCRQIFTHARQFLKLLYSRGLKAGDELLFQLSDNEQFITVFWACLFGKIVPVPVSTGDAAEYKLKVLNIWKILSNPWLVTSTGLLNEMKNHFSKIDCLDEFNKINGKTVLIDNFSSEENDNNFPEILTPLAQDIAFIQFSSGSTGSPKGVIISHQNLSANINAMIKRAGLAENDILLSWMPLTHDMGLIGAFLTGLCAGIPVCLMPPALFIRYPGLWLEKAGEYRASLLFSPNFGINHVLKHFRPSEKKPDLSAVRLIYNGAEPISPDLCFSFLERMKEFGLKKNVFFPGYGLAEGTVGVTIPNPGEELHSLKIQRSSLAIGKEIKVYTENNNNNHDYFHVTEVGYALDCCELTIRDEKGNLLPENHTGYIHISGDSVTSGYYNNKSETDRAIKNGLLKTGDIGFQLNGRLYVTGRSKDIIFVNGQNFFPHDIERIAESAGIPEAGQVVCCGLTNHRLQSEEILLFVLFKKTPADFLPLSRTLRRTVGQTAGIEIHHVIPVKKIPKTTSGKVQRYQFTEKYLAGEYNEIIRQMNEDSLHDPQAQNLGTETPDEEKLLAIWRKALHAPGMNLDDNFFDYGGDSLKASIINAGIEDEFHVSVPLSELFISVTARAMAAYIARAAKKAVIPMEITAPRAYYPLSSQQKRFFIMSAYENIGATYNVTCLLKIEGYLDETRLSAALRLIIKRRESLRTSFKIVSNEPAQIIHENAEITIISREIPENIFTGSSLPDDLMQECIRPFDISQTPLLRVYLLRCGRAGHILVLDMPHIITDGTSLGILLGELTDAYNNKTLPELKIHYKDYAVWQKKAAAESEPLREKYWLDLFRDELPVISLPYDFPRPAAQSFSGGSLFFSFDPQLTREIKKYAESANVTLYSLLLAVYNILLYKYSDAPDILVGSSSAGRTRQEIQNTAGLFVNMLVMRNYPDEQKSFSAFLTEVKNNAVKALENQDYQFDELVKKLNLKRDPSRNPLFDAAFALENMTIPELTFAGQKTVMLESAGKFSMFDLSLFASEVSAGISFRLEYCSDLFKKETVGRMAESFTRIARTVISSPDIAIADISLVNEAEEKRILSLATGEPGENSRRTLCAMFRECAEKNALGIALISGEQRLTWQELDYKSDCLAALLQKAGAGCDDIICLLFNPCPEMIIAMLGVIKSGAAFLPLDPGYPQERTEQLLRNSKSAILLTGENKSLSFSGRQMVLDGSFRYTSEFQSKAVNKQPQNLAYVIYTSGSTGDPKGVMIEEHSLLNLCTWYRRDFSIKPGANILQVIPYTFDASIKNIIAPLISGARLILADYINFSPEKILDLICRHQITHINCVPGVLYSLLACATRNGYRDLAGIRYAALGGEALDCRILRPWVSANNKVRISNIYGPTEGTDISTCYHAEKNDMQKEQLPIGRPIPGVRAYILNRSLRLQPAGIYGELYLAGSQIARGYLNDDALSGKYFTSDPFFPEQRMYRTGDYAKTDSSGNIIFYGRYDKQVKIRGHRIELHEIESAMRRHDAVRECLVLCRPDEHGEKNLSAYYTEKENSGTFIPREYLEKILPRYMIPARFIKLEQFPLSRHGKIDTAALPAGSSDRKVNGEYTPPRDETEQKIIRLWETILKRGRIGIHDNFFELGGDSLEAAVLTSQIKKELNCGISLSDIMSSQTPARLADLVRQKISGSVVSIPGAGKKPFYPLASAQKRIFILSQLHGKDVLYNVPLVLEINGSLNPDRLETAFQQLILRHEALRTSFGFESGEIVQRIHENFTFNLERTALEETKINNLIQSYIKPFNLAQAPLMRAVLAEVSKTRHILIVILHHILIDGVSLNIFKRDLAGLYHNLGLPELPVRYCDYSVWQSDFLASAEVKNQEQYWLTRLSNSNPEIRLPADFPAREQSLNKRKIIRVPLPQEIFTAIGEYNQKTETTPFMFLLAVFSVFAGKYGNSDFNIGIPVTARPHHDLENLLGMFANMLALRVIIDRNAVFEDFLNSLKKETLAAYAHQDYPFEDLVAKLNPGRTVAMNPLFNMVFTVTARQDMHYSPAENSTKFSDYRETYNQMPVSQYDLSFIIHTADSKTDIFIEYPENLFVQKSVEKFADQYIKIAEEVLGNSKIIINNLLHPENSEKLSSVLSGFQQDFSFEKSGMKIKHCPADKRPKLLLGLLPFWQPLIPPLGIASLKSFIQTKGYPVKIFDANINQSLYEPCHMYKKNLRNIIPDHLQKDFQNIAVDILRNHAMAFVNNHPVEMRLDILKMLLQQSFNFIPEIDEITELNNVLTEYFKVLEQYILKLILQEKPDFFGLTLYSGNLASSLFAYKIVKQKYPGIRTITGGGVFANELYPGTENFNRFISHTDYIDSVFIGESELLLLKYLEGELPRSQKVFTLQDIQSELFDISSAPVPDYCDIEVENYYSLATYGSRGCPFTCSFCTETVQWGKFRKKNVHALADELVFLSGKYGKKIIMLGESLINPYITELAVEMKKRNTGILWDGCLRADYAEIDENAVQTWKEGGFFQARIGVESGSEKILSLMNKKTTPDKIAGTIKLLAAAGIKTTTYWLIGHPEENEDDFNMSMNLVDKLKNDIYDLACLPFFYSIKGSIKSDEWMSHYGIKPLYNDKYLDILLIQRWILQSQPTPEEINSRVKRFIDKIKCTKIPLLYTINDLYNADIRWEKLHNYFPDKKNNQKAVYSNTKMAIEKPKLLIGLLPFWVPLMPPLGISLIKGNLINYGYNTTVFDANIEAELWQTYHQYLDFLKKQMNPEKLYNLNQRGFAVLKNHLTAYVNKSDETEYLQAIEFLIRQYFFCRAENHIITELNKIITAFFIQLENYICSLVTAHAPDIAGFTVYDGSLGASLFAYKIIKTRFPHITTIMGGGIFTTSLHPGSPNFSYFTDNQAVNIDKIFVGEGEELLLQYLEGHLDPGKKVYDCDDLQGREFDICKSALPDFTDLKIRSYYNIPVYGSRGCPYNCSFCAEKAIWKTYRRKVPAKIAWEINSMSEKYNTQLFTINDSLLNPYINELSAEMIKNQKSFYWDGPLRADIEVCNPDHTLFWRKGGFYNARIGAESGSGRMLKIMNKRISPEQLASALQALSGSGIKTTTYWVIGHPEETDADFEQTLAFISENSDYIYEAVGIPFEYHKTSVNSVGWEKTWGTSTMFPPEFLDLFTVQKWLLNTSPAPEVLYRREMKFQECLKKIHIPYSSTFNSLYIADKRWKALHKNSVPSMGELNSPDIHVRENLDILLPQSSFEKFMIPGFTSVQQINAAIV